MSSRTDMDPSILQLVLHLSRLVNLHNPLLILSQDEYIPLELCGGIAYPIVCSHYSAGEEMAANLWQNLRNGTEYSPIVISDGDHRALVTKLGRDPILFSETRVWLMPREYASAVPLRLDNNIIFFEKNSSGGFKLHESYSVKSEAPITRKILEFRKFEDTKRVLLSPISRTLNGATLKTSWTASDLKKSRSVNRDIIRALQARMNFTLENVVPEKTKFGVGRIGMLNEDEIDLMTLMISEERQTTLEYSWPIRDHSHTRDVHSRLIIFSNGKNRIFCRRPM